MPRLCHLEWSLYGNQAGWWWWGKRDQEPSGAIVTRQGFRRPGLLATCCVCSTHLYLNLLTGLHISILFIICLICIMLPFFTFTCTSRLLNTTSLILPHPLLWATCSCLNAESLHLNYCPSLSVGIAVFSLFSLQRTLKGLFSLKRGPNSLVWDARLSENSFSPTTSTKTHFLISPLPLLELITFPVGTLLYWHKSWHISHLLYLITVKRTGSTRSDN